LPLRLPQSGKETVGSGEFTGELHAHQRAATPSKENQQSWRDVTSATLPTKPIYIFLTRTALHAKSRDTGPKHARGTKDAHTQAKIYKLRDTREAGGTTALACAV